MTNVDTKSALSGSTSLTAGKPVLTFDATLPSAAQVKAQADKAIDENVRGGALLGRAEQRMMYAVMCESVIMRNAGQTNHGLADAVTDTEVLSFFNSRMSELFAGEKPTTDGSESENTALAIWTKKDKLIRRAVKLGAMIESRNVSYGMFNMTAGLFNVWPSMLYPVGAKPAGRLENDKTLLLDGRSIVYVGKNVKGEDAPARNKTASMTQVIAICGKAPTPRKPQPAKKVSSGATFNLRKIADVADHIEFPVLVGAVLAKLQDGGMRLADWPGAFSNLTKIQQAYDELRDTPDFKLPKEADGDKLAATKAKREAQAAASAAKDAAAKAALAAKNNAA